MFFTILEVLFCVTQNAFNFIELQKKQEHKGTFNQVLYSPMLSSFKLMELVVPFASQNGFLIANAPL